MHRSPLRSRLQEPERPYTALDENGAGDDVANPVNPLVELRGIEPLTLRLPARRKPKK
jgi:hypothetical protein